MALKIVHKSGSASSKLIVYDIVVHKEYYDKFCSNCPNFKKVLKVVAGSWYQSKVKDKVRCQLRRCRRLCGGGSHEH